MGDSKKFPRSAAITLGCLIVLGALGSPALHKAKPAWSMDDAQRVKLRFDSLASSVRRSRAIAEGVTVSADEPNRIFVLGSHDPELIMPAELMGMIAVTYATETELGRKYRARWFREGVERFGDDFWDRLYEAGRPFVDRDLAMRGRLHERSPRKAKATADAAAADEDPSGTDLCLMRANALAAARQKFGREKFDAFLYEVIAPDAGVIESSSSSGPDAMADAALWVEGGCR